MIGFLPLLTFLLALIARPATAQQVDTIRIFGAGTGGSGSGFVTFDWNGPTSAAYGIYDHGCLAWVDEFNALVRDGRPLIGSATPAASTWQAALAAARRSLADARAKAADADVRTFASAARLDLFSAGAATSLMMGSGKAALAQLLAGIELAPNDPDLLFNFAASLAQQDMPNESAAAIQRLRALGTLPKLADGLDAEAAITYLTGYNEMRLGRLAAAKANFTRAIGGGHFLNEAKHALALVLAHEGNIDQAKGTYLAGMWRFKPKQLVHCGASTDDDVRPPVDDMFDTSMGIDGKLVDLWLPDKASDIEPFIKMATDLAGKRLEMAKVLEARMMALSGNPKFSDSDTPYNAWALKTTEVMNSLEEIEPYVVAAREAVDSARIQGARIMGPINGFVVQRILELSMTPGDHCHEIRSIVSNAVRGVLPHAERYEAAQREYARVWYKMATGLNAKIGDQEWHEFNDVSLRHQLEAKNADMVLTLMSFFGMPAPVERCPEPAQSNSMLGQPPVPPGSPCDQIFGDLKINHSFEVPGRTGGPQISYEVGCDKIKADIQYDVLSGKAYGFGTAMGGIASIEIGRKGDYSIFAGARAEASGPGASAGMKSGLYIEGDNGGVTEFGGRVGLDAKAGFGKLSKSASDDMKFNLLPNPPTPPRGPRLKTFSATP